MVNFCGDSENKPISFSQLGSLALLIGSALIVNSAVPLGRHYFRTSTTASNQQLPVQVEEESMVKKKRLDPLKKDLDFTTIGSIGAEKVAP